MARWTVGPDDVVIEAVPGGLVTVHIPSGKPLGLDTTAAQDLRTKVGAAIGIAHAHADVDPTP